MNFLIIFSFFEPQSQMASHFGVEVNIGCVEANYKC